VRLRDLIPWRAFDIATSWSPQVAVIELRKVIDQETFLFGGGGNAPFVGDIRGEAEFRFRRRIGYGNSFLPIIRVVTEPLRHGATRLRVTMRLHLLVMAFMAVWMTGATFGALVGISAVVAGQPGGLLAFALPLFGAGLVGIPFAFEARKAETLLRSIYANAPALPTPPETGQAYR
jgi:hypothetical protein